jgi:general secretion pathway protein A
MYLSFYYLKENPFQINTDPRFLWMGPKHEEGLATLKYGVRNKKGFLLLTGDIGTGKTTLVNALLNTLGENALVAVIRDPNLELLDFFNYIAHAFSMGREFESKGSFLIYFEKFLVEAHAAGKTVLLIIDEAQRITQKMLEEVRLLSNIERHDCKLINIFFVGQIEFNDILLRPENRAIRQRITVNYTIPPLTQVETGMYIRHRLEVAGIHEEIFAPRLNEKSGSKEFDEYNLELPENQKEIFSFGAVKEIFSYSRGYPRLINIICDRCLLTGFVEDAATITPEIVRECRAELRIPESGQVRKENQPGDTEIKEPLGPLESGGQEGKHHVEAADNDNRISAPETGPATPGPGDLNKKENKFFARLLTLLSVVLIAIVVGFLITETVEEEKSTIPGQASPPAQTGKKPSLPEKQKEVSPPDQKESTEPAKPPAEHKNEEKMGDTQRDGEVPALAGPAPRAANRDEDKKIQGQPHLFEKHIIPFSSDTNYPSGISLEELNRLVESLLQQPQFNILLTGHSDSIGNENYNMKLAEFRANTVKSYLIGRGLPESRIKVEGRGSKNPIASNDSLAGRIANRRVEIEIIRPHNE